MPHNNRGIKKNSVAVKVVDQKVPFIIYSFCIHIGHLSL